MHGWNIHFLIWALHCRKWVKWTQCARLKTPSNDAWTSQNGLVLVKAAMLRCYCAHSSYSKNCLVPHGDYYGNHHKSYAHRSVSLLWSPPSEQGSLAHMCLSFVRLNWVASVLSTLKKQLCCGLSLWALLTVSLIQEEAGERWTATDLWWPKKMSHSRPSRGKGVALEICPFHTDWLFPVSLVLF